MYENIPWKLSKQFSGKKLGLEKNILMKFKSWKTLLFEVFFFLLIFFWFDFVFIITTLEIFLPNHTWNVIISFKSYFIIIKIKINKTLVSQ